MAKYGSKFLIAHDATQFTWIGLHQLLNIIRLLASLPEKLPGKQECEWKWMRKRSSKK